MIVVNWLAGKHDNRMHRLQKAIDMLKKTIVHIEQKEKVYLEKSAMYSETAKQCYRANNIRAALFYMKLKLMLDEALQIRRLLCLPLYQELMFVENVKMALISAASAKKKKKKKKLFVSLPMLVFVFFCFFLLSLAYVKTRF
ncbi:hypothetical protein CARUB_v10027335mg [Capsella rubella]|uniref:Uncharacterized protein n=1 Tax=Capsella rubella TaxID=81985 RepID=R0GPA2_9BRAS|nr:hypothetical protein CARUB_v10027335mg [Capsella rubella]